jgi:hypothetical protein
MLDSVINNIMRSDWIILLVVGTILLLATEVGFRVGRRHTPEQRKAHQVRSGTLQGALLGLLGLLLGFTFTMAVADTTRKQLVLDEAKRHRHGVASRRVPQRADSRCRPALLVRSCWRSGCHPAIETLSIAERSLVVRKRLVVLYRRPSLAFLIVGVGYSED